MAAQMSAVVSAGTGLAGRAAGAGQRHRTQERRQEADEEHVEREREAPLPAGKRARVVPQELATLQSASPATQKERPRLVSRQNHADRPGVGAPRVEQQGRAGGHHQQRVDQPAGAAERDERVVRGGERRAGRRHHDVGPAPQRHSSPPRDPRRRPGRPSADRPTASARAQRPGAERRTGAPRRGPAPTSAQPATAISGLLSSCATPEANARCAVRAARAAGPSASSPGVRPRRSRAQAPGQQQRHQDDRDERGRGRSAASSGCHQGARREIEQRRSTMDAANHPRARPGACVMPAQKGPRVHVAAAAIPTNGIIQTASRGWKIRKTPPARPDPVAERVEQQGAAVARGQGAVDAAERCLARVEREHDRGGGGQRLLQREDGEPRAPAPPRGPSRSRRAGSRSRPAP